MHSRGVAKERIERSFGCEIKSIDSKKAQVYAVVSTGNVDRDQEIILPSAFEKHLPKYKANPILCWGHPLSDFVGVKCDPHNLIGRALEINISSRGVECLFQYAVNENPLAKTVFDLVVGGYLKAYSIGAMAIDYTFADDTEEKRRKLPQYAYDALKSGDAWLVHTEMELLEISQVFVGSNREALVACSAKGLLSRSAVEAIKSGKRDSLARTSNLDARLDLLKKSHTSKRLDAFGAILQIARSVSTLQGLTSEHLQASILERLKGMAAANGSGNDPLPLFLARNPAAIPIATAMETAKAIFARAYDENPGALHGMVSGEVKAKTGYDLSPTKAEMLANWAVTWGREPNGWALS